MKFLIVLYQGTREIGSIITVYTLNGPFLCMAKTMNIQALLGGKKLWAERASKWSSSVVVKLLMQPERLQTITNVGAAGLRTSFKIWTLMTSNVGFQHVLVPSQVRTSRDRTWKRYFFVVCNFVTPENIFGFCSEATPFNCAWKRTDLTVDLHVPYKTVFLTCRS